MNDDRRRQYADRLGLPVEVVKRLTLLGVGGPADGGLTYTEPEFDANGNVVGLQQRFPAPDADGLTKKAVPGSHRGLAYLPGWREQVGPVYVVEGWSDTLAMEAAGLTAIGRPSSNGGIDYLADLLRDLPADRSILVVAERDLKPDGRWPGREGAHHVACELANRLGREVRVALPPDGAKDVRAWLTTHAPASGWEAAGKELAAHLDAHAEQPDPDAARSSGGAGEGAESSSSPPTLDLSDLSGPRLDPGPPSKSYDQMRRENEEVLKRQNDPATRLVNIVTENDYRVFCTPAGTSYMTRGRVAWPIDSTDSKRRLIDLSRADKKGLVPKPEHIRAAIAALDAAAAREPVRELHTRVAEHGGRVYVHLANPPDDTVIVVGPDGWRECPDPPVVFRASKNAKPLPMPVPGGTPGELRQFLNTQDDDTFTMVVAWIATAFRPSIPCPILSLVAEQGCGKSTFAKLLVRLIDPRTPELRAEPRDHESLMVAASNCWLLGYDNLSGLTPWMADSFCRLCTGGGDAARKKYTDDEEHVFDVRRPVLWTGIEELSDRGDLLERLLPVHLSAIPADARQTEEDITGRFDAARPQLLGAVFDLIAAGLRRLPDVKLPRLPRMADFAKWAAAVVGPDVIDRRYRDAGEDGHRIVLESSSLTGPLLDLMRGRSDPWEGTATELDSELRRVLGCDRLPVLGERPVPVPKDWPAKPHFLTGRLRRLAPALRHAEGIDVSFDRTGKNRTRTIVIRTLSEDAAASFRRTLMGGAGSVRQDQPDREPGDDLFDDTPDDPPADAAADAEGGRRTLMMRGTGWAGSACEATACGVQFWLADAADADRSLLDQKREEEG